MGMSSEADAAVIERDAEEVHPELRELYKQVRAALTPDVGRSIEERRAQASTVTGLVDVVELADVRDIEIPTADAALFARVYRPDDAASRPGHIHLHGGGWALGSVADADPHARLLAAGLRATVVSLDYRLAPEHPWPAGPEDSYAATCWVAAHADELGIDADDLTIGGDSAGANLATIVAMMCRDRGGPPLRAQWLAIGAYDLTLPSTPSLERYGHGFVLDRDEVQLCIDWYTDPADRRDPYVSPMFGDLRDLPPAVVMSASCDPVADQSDRYAARLREAGVPVTEIRCEGHLHGSMFLTRAAASSRSYFDRSTAALMRARATSR